MIDEARLDRLEQKVDAIALDVRSLLESRSYVQGAWKAIVIISAVMSALITAIHGALWGMPKH